MQEESRNFLNFGRKWNLCLSALLFLQLLSTVNCTAARKSQRTKNIQNCFLRCSSNRRQKAMDHNNTNGTHMLTLWSSQGSGIAVAACVIDLTFCLCKRELKTHLSQIHFEHVWDHHSCERNFPSFLASSSFTSVLA